MPPIAGSAARSIGSCSPWRAAASFSAERRVPASTVAVLPTGSTSAVPASRSRDSTATRSSAGGTDAPTSPVLAPWGSSRTRGSWARRTTSRTSSTDAGWTTRAARPRDAARRHLEAGDVVDTWHEHPSRAGERRGERPVRLHRHSCSGRRERVRRRRRGSAASGDTRLHSDAALRASPVDWLAERTSRAGVERGVPAGRDAFSGQLLHRCKYSGVIRSPHKIRCRRRACCPTSCVVVRDVRGARRHHDHHGSP